MPPDRDAWAAAYLKQSQSDFQVFEILSARSEIAECHRLHYLQMACEKIAKAYRFRDTNTSIEQLLTSHVAFSKFVTGFLRSADIKTRYHNQDAMLREVTGNARRLAREIEKLAPAVDRENRPENAEYPWVDRERIVVPCDYSYPNLTLLKEPTGRSFLKLIKVAIEDFERIRIF